jgi:hypothetical protein
MAATTLAMSLRIEPELIWHGKLFKKKERGQNMAAFFMV